MAKAWTIPWSVIVYTLMTSSPISAFPCSFASYSPLPPQLQSLLLLFCRFLCTLSPFPYLPLKQEIRATAPTATGHLSFFCSSPVKYSGRESRMKARTATMAERVSSHFLGCFWEEQPVHAKPNSICRRKGKALATTRHYFTLATLHLFRQHCEAYNKCFTLGAVIFRPLMISLFLAGQCCDQCLLRWMRLLVEGGEYSLLVLQLSPPFLLPSAPCHLTYRCWALLLATSVSPMADLILDCTGFFSFLLHHTMLSLYSILSQYLRSFSLFQWSLACMLF